MHGEHLEMGSIVFFICQSESRHRLMGWIECWPNTSAPTKTFQFLLEVRIRGKAKDFQNFQVYKESFINRTERRITRIRINFSNISLPPTSPFLSH